MTTVHPGSGATAVAPAESAPIALGQRQWVERIDIAPLQRLVDELSASVDRPVLLNDAGHRLLAHSAAGDHEVDRARVASILQREAPAAVVRHLRRHGIERLDRPTEIAGDEALGMKPSLCCPIRWDGRLLGYLWIIDGDAPLDRFRLHECDVAARDVAALLREKEFLARASRRTQRRLLLGLLAGPCDEVERSVIEAERRNLLVADSDVVVLAAEARADDGGAVTAAVRDALDAATERCSRLAPARRAMAAMQGDRGILLIALEQRAGADDALRYADRLHECLVESFGRLADWTPIVGIGPAVDGLARAAESYECACAAARVARAMDDLGPVTSWNGLGVFRALSSIPPTRVSTLGDIHEGLATLAQTPTGASLIATVETYLDLGADARAAARALHLHRSSLYYRLSKCEAVAGINLRDGGDRLSFHLAVKLARLSGHIERTAATG